MPLSVISRKVSPEEDERDSFMFHTLVEHKQVTSELEFKVESSPRWPLLHMDISMVSVSSFQTQSQEM